MQLFWLLLLVFGGVLGAAPYPQKDIDSGKVLAELSKKAYNNAWSRLERSGTRSCNKNNVRIFKEWRHIPGKERIAYTNAVQCLQNKPGILSLFEGSKTAFDDFAVLHILLVQYVHVSASFLLFHRYFLYTYAEKLRECGYNGPVPYWEWGLDCDDVDASPLFDGSATSLGSNGKFIPDRTSGPIPGLEIPGVPLGTGGGCVHSGPFKNYTVNMGNVLDPDPTRYNPRCLKRDLNPHICKQWASFRNATQLILDSPNIELFQAIMQGDSRYPEAADLFFGVHGGGHNVVSGDPGSDFFFSPLEPVFWLHHQQLDRLYFVWQNLDWKNRQNIAGTRSWSSVPLRQQATLKDVLLFEPLNRKRTLGELIDTLGGTPFCFIYE
ncbi:Tyrosinase P [Paramyrothecium foliicola]|nr:Tyrosinase P [Paramyrothecium foliicola]